MKITSAANARQPDRNASVTSTQVSRSLGSETYRDLYARFGQRRIDASATDATTDMEGVQTHGA